MKIYLLFFADFVRAFSRAFADAKYNFCLRRIAAQKERDARDFARWLVDMGLPTPQQLAEQATKHILEEVSRTRRLRFRRWNTVQPEPTKGDLAMSRSSLYGSNYPPGCSGPPDYQDYPCDVCGGIPDGDPESHYTCICPECPVCGATGDPDCYAWHGLRRSEEQKFGRECTKRLLENERFKEAQFLKQLSMWRPLMGPGAN